MSATTLAIQRDETRVGEGVSTGILLYLMLFSLTGSIAVADWADDLGLLTFAAAGGLTLGILLAKIRRVPGIIAHLLMLLLAIPGIATIVVSILPGVLTYQEKLVVLWERVKTWALRVMAGGPGSDSMVFVIQLCFITWILAYVAAWSVYRQHQVWGALLPSGLALTVNLFYAAPQSGLYFGLYVLSALLLLVRLNLQKMEQGWRNAAVGYSTDISIDFMWYGALFTLMLMFLVWLLPASAPGPSWLGVLEPLQTPWQSVEDQFNRVFNTLRAVGRPSSSAFFGTTLAMGGPVNLGQRPVMEIKSEYGRYWRAVVYDKYTGIGWINTHLDSLNLSPDDPRLGETRSFYRAEVTQTVKLYVNDQNLLYAQSLPVRFDIPTEIRYAKLATELSPPNLDVALVRSRRPMREPLVYNVVSAISVADEDSLRSDSIRYSEWITATYLQLPDELPARVRSLAQQVTRPFDNPYDKAAALESFVRQRIKYNDQVSAVPSGRDGVDYTLFDRQEGYCNYYASVLAVVARAVGLPARVASGYSLGDYQDGVFHVVEANAHSWVEIYFPNYGWIEFEPTANKPEINRPKKSTPLNPDLENAASEARRRQPRNKDMEDEDSSFNPGRLPWQVNLWNEPGVLVAIGGGLVGLGLVGFLAVLMVRQSRRRARLSPAGRVYEEMLTRARWLGIRDQGFATPLERARTINSSLPSAEGETDRIVSYYTRERFSAHELAEAERSALSDAWDQWRVKWSQGLVARITAKTASPFRALVEDARRFKRRIERM